MSKEAKAIEDLRRELRVDLRSIKDKLQQVAELKAEIQQVLKLNQDLRAENAKLSCRIEELEQYQRSNNIEIKGIPLEGEPLTIVSQTAALIKEEVSEADIDICHRVPTARIDQANIIVRFVRRTKRNAFLSKAKKAKIDAGALGFQSPSKVFVNKHLTRYGKRLLGAAVERKKELRWRFVWTAGGKVFVRKDENSPVVRIASMEDVEKMTA
ncbi:hypothetical protein HPB50_017335 [Hyalomma asiaticum]|uniref:Uncharacterized protein n=1 Tax=Hyalomma asiaticum TaxID=266040 RepID=A0ACB7S0U9_HYAAI|nr:hypothetical protein HPB50_017335 [Hyalomma asiaticum]